MMEYQRSVGFDDRLAHCFWMPLPVFGALVTWDERGVHKV